MDSIISDLGALVPAPAAAGALEWGGVDERTLADLQVEVVNPLTDPRWDRDVVQHPDYCLFHTSIWADVLCRTYGHEPCYLRCSRDGELAALVPLMEVNSFVTGRRGICLPFSDFCAPLLFSNCPANSVAEAVIQMARKRRWKHIDIRGRGTFPESIPASVAFFSHKIDLRGGAEAIFARVKGSVRRAVRRAERSDLRLDTNGSPEAMSTFYNLQVQTRRRHGLPPQPLGFFRQIYQQVIKPGHGFIVVAESQGRPVSAMVFFRHGNGAIYKFGASDKALQEYRANNLTMWTGIQHLADRGCQTLHFGRSSLANKGLRQFKLSWGPEEGLLEYFRLDPKTRHSTPTRDRTTGRHTTIFARLPLVLNRAAGALIYPHLD